MTTTSPVCCVGSALTKLGHDVCQARNGREALHAWQGDDIPFIISDWMMPDLDGLEFCRQIRAEQREGYTYVVLLTSRSGRKNFLEAMNAGADDFLTKPFENEALAARVRVGERILGLHANLRAVNNSLEQRVVERTVALEAALRVKEEFLSQVSHELRTPLGHVIGFAQLLELDGPTESQARSVREILTSGERLLALIERLLAVSENSSVDLRLVDPARPAGYAPVFAPLPALYPGPQMKARV